MSVPPDAVAVACSWVRSQVAGVTVSPDLVGWAQGESWVEIRRVTGRGMEWPYRYEDVVLDVDVRAAERASLHTLRSQVREAMLALATQAAVAGATVTSTDEEVVVDMPFSPDEGHRSVVTYAVRLRAA